MKIRYLANKLNFSSQRWSVFSRVLAAIFGGYIVATTSALFISQLLMQSMGKLQAVHSGLLLTFLIYTCAVIWVFSVSSANKAWLGLIKLTVLLSIATWLLLQFNGVANL